MLQHDSNVEVARLQSDITALLGMVQENIVFNFKQRNDTVKLDMVTVNPKHEQSFLFHSTTGIDKADALRKMLEYIQTNYHHENSMTVQWMKVGENKLQTSYFRALNMYEALDKFYYERDLNQYKIFSISLNPVS
ncbi:MAG: hypothetical protein M9931_02130 [Chitinophagales bacterium]|nr:hypothetical protein [Chitinophagales bacterium]MCO5279835.1 hypothetical protein [Chitinophagales bacterium]HRN94762.1 hypothetical protein [Chitinophagales bacterium]HRP38836.1 hypothetical protein [Chitinophagales bacterium]